MVLPIKILLTSQNNFEDSFSAAFPQCGQLDKVRLRTLTFVLCSQLRDCVVAEIIPWRDRLHFARCVASFHLEPTPRRACRRPTAAQRPRARSEHRTCEPVFAKLAVPHCSCEKSHNVSASRSHEDHFDSLGRDIRQPRYDIVSWLVNFRCLPPSFPNRHSVCGPWYSWFARPPTTRVAHLVFQGSLSCHCSFVRGRGLESVYVVFCWSLHVLLWIKVLVLRSCQQSSQFHYSRATATASDPGTCWSAHRKHLREFG